MDWSYLGHGQVVYLKLSCKPNKNMAGPKEKKRDATWRSRLQIWTSSLAGGTKHCPRIYIYGTGTSFSFALFTQNLRWIWFYTQKVKTQRTISTTHKTKQKYCCRAPQFNPVSDFQDSALTLCTSQQGRHVYRHYKNHHSTWAKLTTMAEKLSISCMLAMNGRKTFNHTANFGLVDPALNTLTLLLKWDE